MLTTTRRTALRNPESKQSQKINEAVLCQPEIRTTHR